MHGKAQAVHREKDDYLVTTLSKASLPGFLLPENGGCLPGSPNSVSSSGQQAFFASLAHTSSSH